MPDMMVLARCVGAETQLQRVTAGWWNQLIENIDSTVLELWSDQWSLHQRCFHIDVSSLSRLVVWRCLADSVLASSSAGRCDVRATRRHCSTYLLYCTVFRFCTLVHFRCCWFEKCRWTLVRCVMSCIDSGIFWTGIFEMPEEYIMVEHAVDRSLSGEQTWCRYVRWGVYWIHGGEFGDSSRTVGCVCVCGGVIYRWTPSWYGNFASDWGIAGSP